MTIARDENVDLSKSLLWTMVMEQEERVGLQHKDATLVLSDMFKV